ncbi:MAG TPA: hypothetical protein VGH63_00875 [Polyangia bacterium]
MRAIDFSRQTRDERCLSDLALDRLVAGEPVDAAVTTHAADCARCSGRLDEFRRARAFDAPLLDELRAIMHWTYAEDSVVLIDDVRMMGREGWPEASEVEELCALLWNVETRDDVIRCVPSV